MILMWYGMWWQVIAVLCTRCLSRLVEVRYCSCHYIFQGDTYYSCPVLSYLIETTGVSRYYRCIWWYADGGITTSTSQKFGAAAGELVVSIRGHVSIHTYTHTYYSELVPSGPIAISVQWREQHQATFGRPFSAVCFAIRVTGAS